MKRIVFSAIFLVGQFLFSQSIETATIRGWVYDTQDQASDFEDTHTQLTSLVSNCLEYMNVSFAALVLSENKFRAYDAVESIENEDLQDVLAILSRHLYEWVKASQKVIVINEVDDKIGAMLCPGLPYRVIAAPLMGGGDAGGSSGILVVGRSYAERPFTNNDRNLVDVMSRKASKLVQASYDSQTGLMKRAGFEYQVARALQAAKLVNATHALFVLDIDRMQVINDTLGYEAGDMVISAVAQVLKNQLRNNDSVARLAGDQYGVLLHQCGIDAAKKICEKIVAAIDALNLEWKEKKVDVQVSIGLSVLSSDADDVTVGIANAEVACAFIKERGGNAVGIFGSSDSELVRRKTYMDLVARIQDNLRLNRFELHYQPIQPLDTNIKEVHGEILLRMRGDDGELVSPGLFLPAAERYHLMPAIDRWVFAKTVEQIQQFGVLDFYPGMLVSINLSGQTLSDTSFIEFVKDMLKRSGIPGSCICFEITETAAIADVSQAKHFIDTFRLKDVYFSLDDFGTGLSSFSYLKELPVDFLKIDGSFVKEICTDQIADTMVAAINEVGHSMGLKTIGEFVENDEIANRLKKIGVDYGQGYGLAKPAPFADFLAALMAEQSVKGTG